jgi:hypothetical protein
MQGRKDERWLASFKVGQAFLSVVASKVGQTFLSAVAKKVGQTFLSAILTADRNVCDTLDYDPPSLKGRRKEAALRKVLITLTG